MAGVRASFKQADLTRAVKAARAAGLNVARIEIDPDGKIVLVHNTETISGPLSALDEWKAKKNARSS